MTEISVSYERKFSDGSYGSEGLSLTWTAEYEDDFAFDDAALSARCEAFAQALRAEVLGQLARSAALMVARAAQRELQPPPPPPTREPVPAGPAQVDLEDLPF